MVRPAHLIGTVAADPVRLEQGYHDGKRVRADVAKNWIDVAGPDGHARIANAELARFAGAVARAGSSAAPLESSAQQPVAQPAPIGVATQRALIPNG